MQLFTNQKVFKIDDFNIINVQPFSSRKRVLKDVSIYELNLSTRTLNILSRNDILTLNDLSMYNVELLKNIKGFGNKCMCDLLIKLNEFLKQY